jgi:4-hydroxybenzoyl-CoA thioesterase
MTAFTFRRPVRFEDVDSARVVFFARYGNIVHEAMEAFFGGADGGYAGMVTKRDVGYPTVRLEVTYAAPLRYGDVALDAVTIEHLGRTSVRFRHELRREGDGVLCATALHTVVCCTMETMQSRVPPDDVRALLERYVA